MRPGTRKNVWWVQEFRQLYDRTSSTVCHSNVSTAKGISINICLDIPKEEEVGSKSPAILSLSSCVLVVSLHSEVEILVTETLRNASYKLINGRNCKKQKKRRVWKAGKTWKKDREGYSPPNPLSMKHLQPKEGQSRRHEPECYWHTFKAQGIADASVVLRPYRTAVGILMKLNEDCSPTHLLMWPSGV